MSAKTLRVGDPLPDLELAGPGSGRTRLRDLSRNKVLVVFFYPRDDSPGCTIESCTFRDRYEEFVKAGAEVVGISSDSIASHERFAEKHRLPFLLLSDPDGAARNAFGVSSTFGLLPGRATFIIDRAGTIRHVFESQIRVRAHVEGAVEVVRSLALGSTAA